MLKAPTWLRYAWCCPCACMNTMHSHTHTRLPYAYALGMTHTQCVLHTSHRPPTSPHVTTTVHRCHAYTQSRAAHVSTVMHNTHTEKLTEAHSRHICMHTRCKTWILTSNVHVTLACLKMHRCGHMCCNCMSDMCNAPFTCTHSCKSWSMDTCTHARHLHVPRTTSLQSTCVCIHVHVQGCHMHAHRR